jgi:hypothetical protein
MKVSLREVLAESHIAAVAVAVLLLWAITSAAWAISTPVYRAAEFVVTAVAILGIPYSSHTWNASDWFMFVTTGYSLYGALVSFAGAWVLSHWVYGVGPFRALIEYRGKIARRSNA